MKILNVVQLTQSMFADLEQELELSTVFHASAKEVKLGQIIALLSSLLEYETSFEYSMTIMILCVEQRRFQPCVALPFSREWLPFTCSDIRKTKKLAYQSGH